MQQLELEKACCFKKSRNLPFKGKRPALSLLDVFSFLLLHFSSRSLTHINKNFHFNRCTSQTQYPTLHKYCITEW